MELWAPVNSCVYGGCWCSEDVSAVCDGRGGCECESNCEAPSASAWVEEVYPSVPAPWV